MGMLNGGVYTETVCREPTLTKQSEAAACDINLIMKNYDRTGLLPQAVKEAVFMDVSEVGDFRTALAVIQTAQEGFMRLPAVVRAEFRNDPAEFVDFCSDPGNRARLVELGLVEAETPPPVVASVEPAQPTS